jgi:pyridoxal phosphate enzyme (YggS family)
MDHAASIAANIAEVRARIAAAAGRSGRDPATITLVAVTKTHPPELVDDALAAGVHDFGENRVAEAAEKIPFVARRDNVRWHLIGHLQRNKARKAAGLFDLVHSLDSLRLAEVLDRYMHEDTASPDVAPRRLPVLLQVNIAGEVQKEGFDVAGGAQNRDALERFCQDVARILALDGLEVRGLMTIAPYVAGAEEARPVFRQLRELRDDLAIRFPGASWSELSMGMTGDFEIAVEEGATLVRVGRAIFGERRNL